MPAICFAFPAARAISVAIVARWPCSPILPPKLFSIQNTHGEFMNSLSRKLSQRGLFSA